MIKLHKDKSIGKVVYIVEGQVTEMKLLGHIFTNVLDYSLVQVNRGQNPIPVLKYESNANKNSRIFLINAKNSSIVYANNESGQMYLDNVYQKVFEMLGIDLSNAATYYIFDRDPGSNRHKDCKSLIKILKNSRDNSAEANGLLLLSYPSIESYQITGVDELPQEKCASAQELKTIVAQDKYNIENMQDGNIICACVNMLQSIGNIAGRNLQSDDLDNFEELGMNIFEKEHRLWAREHNFQLLSLLSVSFLDLGILQEAKDE